MKCWGDGSSGTLGDGSGATRSMPVQAVGLTSGVTPTLVPGLANASRAAAGSYHTCAMSTGGALSCWGGNFDGQLGDGTTANHLTPAAVLDP